MRRIYLKLRHSLVFCLALQSLLLATWDASAAPGGEGRVNVNDCVEPRCETKGISMTVQYSASTLLGSPLVNVRVAWTGSVVRYLKPIYRQADPSIMLGSYESRVPGAMRLYDTRVRINVRHAHQIYHLDADPGVPAPPGKKFSLNVASSPDWSRMFTDKNGNYLEAAHAKRIMNDGLKVINAQLISSKMDTSKFEKWWFDKNRERYLEPLRKGIYQRLGALQTVFDVPVYDLRKKIEQIGRSGDPEEALLKLQDIFEKLSSSNLPRKFIGTDFVSDIDLKKYADAIEWTTEPLARAMQGLPPLPGSSEAYDTWHDAMEVRLKADQLRIAELKKRQAEIEYAKQKKREAEERRKRKKEALAKKRRLRKEREREARRAAKARRLREARRRAAQARRPSSVFESFSSTLQNSGWGYGNYGSNYGSSGWGYNYGSNYGSTGSYSSQPERSAAPPAALNCQRCNDFTQPDGTVTTTCTPWRCDAMGRSGGSGGALQQ